MTGRPPAPTLELVRGRHFWGCSIPWLPDLLGHAATVTLTGNPLSEAFGRQIAFLRAIAAGAPEGSSLQLRFTADSSESGIQLHIVGAATSKNNAELLNRIVTTALPPEFPLEPLDTESAAAVLKAVNPDGLEIDHLVEIRRSVDRLDPTIDSAGRDDPVLFPWAWSPQALLASLGLLRFQPATTVLAVQVEPAKLPPSAASFLQDEIRRLAIDLSEGEENPLALSVLQSYRRWLRLLPRSCVSLRVLLATAGPLTPGIAESLSTDLTRSFEAGASGVAGEAEVLAPTSPADLDACAMMLAELRSSRWRTPADPDIAALLHLFDPLEANTAFRLPVAPRGGLAGIASRRLSALGQGITVLPSDSEVAIGTASSGARFALSRADLAQHVLVSGLPGFGKTSTVQLILHRLHRDSGVPFLVIDPSKRDYEPLLQGIRDKGVDVGIHRLTRTEVAANPLAVPRGVDPSVHAGRILAAFDTALDLSASWPLAYVQLARSVYRLYEELTDGSEQPTMRDLYRTVGDLIRRSRFSAEVRGNLEGSLLGRLEHLASGPAGRSLSGGPDDRIPWVDLLNRPTLIELGGFAAPAERSLLFGLLIAGLVSYREANPLEPGQLHITVLEEAHRVLRPSRSSDAGVEVFIDAIAELRGAGEGFIVVDQAPSLLHSGLLKLTGTKLTHRLVEYVERTSVGATMVLDGAQTDDIARLAPRRLMAYSASGFGASLIDVDDWFRSQDLPRSVPSPALVENARGEPLFCIECPVMCRGREGLKRRGELTLETGDSLGDLLDRARGMTATPSAAYCLSAATIGDQTQGSPSVLRETLTVLAETFSKKTTRQTPHA